MTISPAERKEQEASYQAAIEGGAFYHGSSQIEAVDSLVEGVKDLPDEVYEEVGSEVLTLVSSVTRREPIRISESINPDRVKEIVDRLGAIGASSVTEFMQTMAEKLSAPYVSYAGENPVYIVLPFGVIPGYEQPKGSPMQLPVLPT